MLLIINKSSIINLDNIIHIEVSERDINNTIAITMHLWDINSSENKSINTDEIRLYVDGYDRKKDIMDDFIYQLKNNKNGIIELDYKD
jgi:hypothetical protein